MVSDKERAIWHFKNIPSSICSIDTSEVGDVVAIFDITFHFIFAQYYYYVEPLYRNHFTPPFAYNYIFDSVLHMTSYIPENKSGKN